MSRAPSRQDRTSHQARRLHLRVRPLSLNQLFQSGNEIGPACVFDLQHLRQLGVPVLSLLLLNDNPVLFKLQCSTRLLESKSFSGIGHTFGFRRPYLRVCLSSLGIGASQHQVPCGRHPGARPLERAASVAPTNKHPAPVSALGFEWPTQQRVEAGEPQQRELQVIQRLIRQLGPAP